MYSCSSTVQDISFKAVSRNCAQMCVCVRVRACVCLFIPRFQRPPSWLESRPFKKKKKEANSWLACGWTSCTWWDCTLCCRRRDTGSRIAQSAKWYFNFISWICAAIEKTWHRDSIACTHMEYIHLNPVRDLFLCIECKAERGFRISIITYIMKRSIVTEVIMNNNTQYRIFHLHN